MSYNPVRAQGGGVARRQRVQNPHGGRKHSAIVAHQGPQGISVVDAQSRKTSAHGWMVPQFTGDQFEVVYHYFCARNDTGEIRNDKHDRCIKVLAGQIFVLLSGQQQATPVNAGQTFTIEKGTPYRIATSGTGDAELLFCQGSGYEDSVERVSVSGGSNLIPASRPVVATKKPVRRTPSKAQGYAQEIVEKQTKREAARRSPVKTREPLANSSAVMGVNPRPVGAGGYSE